MKIHYPLYLIFLLIACNPSAEQQQAENPEIQKSEIDINQKLKDLGIELPDAPAPVANYVNAVQSGKLIFLSGKGPKKADGTYIQGKVGRDLSILGIISKPILLLGTFLGELLFTMD